MLRSLPHGHVAAVLGTVRKIGLERLLSAGQAPARLVALVLAMIVARVINPASKLATARQLDAMTATSSLGALLGLGTVSEQELYTALDWLLSANHTLNASSFAASAPGNSGAVPCDVKLFRGTHLSAGAARLQP